MAYFFSKVVVSVNKTFFSNRIKFDQANELLDKFGAMGATERGCITLGEFAAYLRVPVSPALEEMFSMYDRVSYEEINIICSIWK